MVVPITLTGLKPKMPRPLLVINATVEYPKPPEPVPEPEPEPALDPDSVVDLMIGVYPPTQRPAVGAILKNCYDLPRGYLLCDGAAVCRMKFCMLFEAIETEYGEGDGHSTFNLPNLSNDQEPDATYIIKYDLDSDINPYRDPNVVPIAIGTYPPIERPQVGAILSSTDGVPHGYFACNGEAKSREMYPYLFEAIGTEYGEGDPTTFYLPNLQNEDNPDLTYIIKYDHFSDIPPFTDPNIVPLDIGEYPSVQTVLPGAILLQTENGIPPGYLLCDGSAVSRHQYPMLFEIIGTRYGEGDGHSTFHLPHLSTECMPDSRYIIKYDIDSDQDPVVAPIEVGEYIPDEIVVTGAIRASGIIPEGYLRCDGSTVSRHTYADLFDVIGTYYGEGDGHSTFSIPNLEDGSDLIYSIKYTVTPEPDLCFEEPCVESCIEPCIEPCIEYVDAYIA